MAKNTTKTSPKSSTTAKGSMFAQSLSSKKEQKSKSSFTVVNEYSLTPDERKSIKDIRIIRVNRTKDGDVLKAKVTIGGDSYEYELLHHWEFAAGDTLDKSSITLCNLEDSKGNLKSYNGEPVVYLYGDVE